MNEDIVAIDRFESKLNNRLEVEIYIIGGWVSRLNTKQNLVA